MIADVKGTHLFAKFKLVRCADGRAREIPMMSSYHPCNLPRQFLSVLTAYTGARSRLSKHWTPATVMSAEDFRFVIQGVTFTKRSPADQVHDIETGVGDY